MRHWEAYPGSQQLRYGTLITHISNILVGVQPNWSKPVSKLWLFKTHLFVDLFITNSVLLLWMSSLTQPCVVFCCHLGLMQRSGSAGGGLPPDGQCPVKMTQVSQIKLSLMSKLLADGHVFIVSAPFSISVTQRS